MVRIAVAYLAIAVAGILLVTGLPFGLLDGAPQQAEAPTSEAAPQIVVEAEPETRPEVVEEVVAEVAAEVPAPIPEILPQVAAQVSPTAEIEAGIEAGIEAQIVAEITAVPEAEKGLFSEVTAWLSMSEPEVLQTASAPLSPSIPATTEGSIADTTALILKELSAPAAQVDAQGVTDGLDMSNDALATLQAAKGADDLGIEVTLERLLASAMAAGQSSEQIDRLINEAASQGSVRVPASMVTTDGRVDTMVLMASIVALTKVETNEQGDNSANDSFVTAETAILDIEDMQYLVQDGDSLGALALRFYGNPQLFQPIFEANRAILATPSSIRAGQQLLIPSRAKL